MESEDKLQEQKKVTVILIQQTKHSLKILIEILFC